MDTLISVKELPDTLNGFPVNMVQVHPATGEATVLVIRDPENAPNHRDMVVATWWPALGKTWYSGTYVVNEDSNTAQERAQAIFHERARRASRKGCAD